MREFAISQKPLVRNVTARYVNFGRFRPNILARRGLRAANRPSGLFTRRPCGHVFDDAQYRFSVVVLPPERWIVSTESEIANVPSSAVAPLI